MVTLHEVITFLVSMQISISSLQTHNVNRCGRSRHLARKLSLRRKRSRSEERFSRNAETDLVCRLLLEKKKPALRDNGGTSCTHALQQSSPAINTAWTGIPGSHPFACETYDQTWFKRGNATDPQGTGCDVGAFQFRETISPSGLGCTN